jgi:hypothetical protein
METFIFGGFQSNFEFRLELLASEPLDSVFLKWYREIIPKQKPSHYILEKTEPVFLYNMKRDIHKYE